MSGLGVDGLVKLTKSIIFVPRLIVNDALPQFVQRQD